MGLCLVRTDACTDTLFAGNPTAVGVLPAPRAGQWMQQVAREMHLAETALLGRHPHGGALRWPTRTPQAQRSHRQPFFSRWEGRG